jgi:nucleotide-binding universal stress UspA family protein
MTLVRPFDMIIHVVHISGKESEGLDRARMASIKKHLEEKYEGYRFICDVIRHEEVIQGLQDYIERKEIDLLALTTHKRGVIERLFNPSIARKMVFHSYVPLLVFHS